jgi:hypothetical protein
MKQTDLALAECRVELKENELSKREARNEPNRPVFLCTGAAGLVCVCVCVCV